MTAKYPVLGIDFGKVYFGFAWAKSPLVEPMQTVAKEDVWVFIQDLIDKNPDLKQIVVGVSEGEMAAITEDFVARLREQVPIPVITHDETLSTQAVSNKIAHKKKKTRRGHDHHFAAAVILQDYIDTRL